MTKVRCAVTSLTSHAGNFHAVAGELTLAASILLFIACVATPFSARATIPAGERQVLINLYNSSNGDSWTDNTNWCNAACPSSGAPVFNATGTECTWYGITCDNGQTHVTAIGLSNNRLTGTLPDLSGLTNLQYFAVVSNQLTGSIPSLSSLTQLQTFYVNANQLTGSIPSLAGLSQLGDFSVGFNQLSGSLPSLAGLTNLYSFSATNNQLGGSIPSLSGLTGLQAFQVGGNQLSGSLPSLSGLANLLELSVDRNQLGGAISNLAGSAKLYHVNVGSNKFSGTVPAAPPSLYTPLAFSLSALCSNLLSTAPSANDAGWNSASGSTPWWATPYSSNKCDDIFTGIFEP